jgi:hypothetical protein
MISYSDQDNKLIVRDWHKLQPILSLSNLAEVFNLSEVQRGG